MNAFEEDMITFALIVALLFCVFIIGYIAIGGAGA